MNKNHLDKDRYQYQNQLNIEQNAQLSDVYECREDDLCFVVDWYDDSQNIVGIGVSHNDPDCTVKLTLNVKPGLFVLSGDVNMLRTVAALYGYDTVHSYDRVTYRSNNFTILDVMLDRDAVLTGKNYLCKIETRSTVDSLRLHGIFKRENDTKYKFAAVTHYWNVTKQVMFELVCVKRTCCCDDLTVPKIVYRWFDRALRPYAIAEPQIPSISFDIETVSSDPYRVPTGEAVDDVLFTTSIHHVDSNILYTLVYLPMLDRRPEQMLEEMRRLDKYPTYANQKNVTEVFVSEIDLLKRTMELLKYPQIEQRSKKKTSCVYPTNNRLHYLIGYNSLRYDIKYLLLRCQFYGLHHGEFVYKNGYSFGFHQIHVDLFCVAIMRYKLKNYKLDTLSFEILNSKKENVDAVALRYTFNHIRRRQCLYAQDDPYMAKHRMPSLRDAVHYNNRDTLLVSEIVQKTSTIKYVLDYAYRSRVPVNSINVNYNKIKFRLLNQCEVTGLENGIFLTGLKSSRQTLIVPLSHPELEPAFEHDRLIPNDFVCRDIDNETLLGGGKKMSTGKKTRYPGGVNYCRGEYEVADIQEYDYRIAYPLLMDRLNISDETCTVMKSSDVAQLYPFIKCKNEYRVFDYNTHVSDTKTGTRILLHRYLYDDANPGHEFPFAFDDLKAREDAPVIVIWNGTYRGILSEIIKCFNSTRENAKTRRNQLSGILEDLEMSLQRDYEEAELRKMTIEDSTTKFIGNIDNKNDGLFDDTLNPLSDNANDFDDAPSPFTDVESKDQSNIDADDDEFDDPGPLDDDDDDKNDNGDDGADDNGFDDAPSPLSDDNVNEENVGDRNDDGDVSGRLNENLRSRITNKTTKTADVAEKLIYNFKCPYIEEHYGGNVEILIPENIDREESIRVREIVREIIQLERDAQNNLYLTLKPVVASIYGVIGAMKPEMAAAITCIIRTTLLNEAKYAIALGRQVYYCDTDCIQMNSGEDLSAKLNQLYPYTEITMKNKGRCQYVRPKVYYRYEDGFLKYGANANGPPMWRTAVEYFERYTSVTSSTDVLQAFRNFFKHIYDTVLNDCTDHDEFSGFHWLTHEIKVTNRKSTEELRAYLRTNYKSLAGSYRQIVYYYQNESDVTQTIYRPSIEICSRNNDTFDRQTDTDVADGMSVRQRQIVRLQNVNLFKFFYSSFSTIFNLLNFHVKRNNEPFNVSLNDTHVRYLMLCAYLDVYHVFLKNHGELDYRYSSFLPITNADRSDVGETNSMIIADEEKHNS